MAIQFRCDNCGKSLKADDSKAGKRVKCPGCESVISIPNPESHDDLVANFGPSADEDQNPFRSPQSAQNAVRSQDHGNETLTSPGTRLIGAILSSLVIMVFLVPGFVCFIMANDDQSNPNPAMIAVAFSVFGLGFVTWLGLNIYLLATRSQSIAKYLLRIQIRDYETRQPASFVKTAILRGFVNWLLCYIPFYGLLDVLFIFSEEHRCIHDRLAGTYVVNLP